MIEAHNYRLSPNFTLDELISSETAARQGIDNTPPPAVIDELHRLCTEILQPLREALGRPIVVSSGYRSPAVNRAVGGASRSDHMDGRAADIKVPGMSPLDVCRAVIQLGLPFDQVIHEAPASGGWCHVAIAREGVAPRRQQLTAHFGGGGPSYSSGIA